MAGQKGKNMKLNLYISVIRKDVIVHITNGEKFMHLGTVGSAYTELPEDYLNNANVIDVFNRFNCMVIDAVV